MAFSCQIITPEGILFSSDHVTQLKIPNAGEQGGTFALLSAHAPLIAKTMKGKLLIEESNSKEEKKIEIDESFIRVENNVVTILVN